MNIHRPGRDAVAIRVEDGDFVITWDDGVETRTASDALRARTRAYSIATHQFLERKRRLWPRPRV